MLPLPCSCSQERACTFECRLRLEGESRAEGAPAVSDLRSLYAVTMTTASIPWRSCAFCHGTEGEGVALE